MGGMISGVRSMSPTPEISSMKIGGQAFKAFSRSAGRRTYFFALVKNAPSLVGSGTFCFNEQQASQITPPGAVK